EAYMAIRSKRQALCHGASQTLRSSTYRRQPNSCLSRSKDSRSVNPMDAVFNSIRRIRFRRGPQRLLGGMAGGIANGLNLDVWLVRLLMFLSFLLPFIGVVLYIVVWIGTPWQDGSIRWNGHYPISHQNTNAWVGTYSYPASICSTAVASESFKNLVMRSTSSVSPMAAAAGPSEYRARRKPRLGLCSQGIGPAPFQPAPRSESSPRW